MEEVIVYEKITTWLKHKVVVNVASQEGALDKVVSICEKDGVDGLFDALPDVDVYDTTEQCECEESMLPKDNGGCSTIEVMTKDRQIYWDNAEIH